MGGGRTLIPDLGFFEIFAECSISLAGFGAVHAALRGSIGPRGPFRAWAVVSTGALSFVLSILPLLLAFASLSTDLLWRSASAFGVAGAGATAYSFIALDIRMTRLGHRPQAPLGIRFGQLFSILAILVMLVNLIGWPWPPGPLAYATGLTLILTTGLVALLHSFLLPLRIVLGGGDPEPPDDPPDA